MKKKILVRGPALSRSGYGEQTRFALRALKRYQDKIDIFLITTSWGATSWITEDDEERQWIDGLLQKTLDYSHSSPNPSYDASLQVTIPGEWEPLAPINIGYTAGVESTKISPQWLEKTFLMNKIIVPSNHTKNVFESTQWPAQHQGKQIQVTCKTPIDVVAFPAKEVEEETIDLNLETDFNFLAVAQVSPRKNIFNTIKWFVEAFHDDDTVGMVVKLSMAKNCHIDKVNTKTNLQRLLADFPDRKCKVYLLHGTLTEGQMKSLYTNEKIKAIVSTSHGEGFGLPLFEAAQHGLPVVAPSWSGQKDFLFAPVTNKKTKKTKKRSLFTKVDYELKPVQQEAVWDNVIIPQSLWCYPKQGSYAMALQKVHKDHSFAKSQAKKLQKHIVETFSEDKQYTAFVEALGVSLSLDENIEDVQAWFNELNKNVETHT